MLVKHDFLEWLVENNVTISNEEEFFEVLDIYNFQQSTAYKANLYFDKYIQPILDKQPIAIVKVRAWME